MPIQKPGRIVVPWLLLAAVFAVDLGIPPETPVGPFYAAVLLLALWSSRATHAFTLAMTASVLISAELVISAPRQISTTRSVNTAIAIFALWIMAIGVRRYAAGTAQRELALRRTGDLEYALDQSAIVATTDVRGDIIYVNDTFCRISKYSREELLGQNHRILNSGLHPPEYFKDLWRSIASGLVWRGEIRNRAKDGSLYWVDTTIVPFMDSLGKPYQYASIRYDITERKASETRLRDQSALAQLGRMAAVVAHEVRNPLAGIRGALQVIDSRLDPAARERAVIKEVITRVDTLNSIVEDLLLFARPRPPVPTTVSLRELAAAVTTLLGNDPAFAEVTIDTTHMDGVIVADSELMKLVLVNLITNAAQAMKSRGRIVLGARRQDEWDELSVTDEGPGILPDVMARLFEPFFTTKSRGTGLGLATVRRLVEAQGGEATIACPPSGGTVATIRLPARHNGGGT